MSHESEFVPKSRAPQLDQLRLPVVNSVTFSSVIIITQCLEIYGCTQFLPLRLGLDGMRAGDVIGRGLSSDSRGERDQILAEVADWTIPVVIRSSQ